MSPLATSFFPKTCGSGGFREKSSPFWPRRDAQILDPIEPHNQLPTLAYKNTLALQFSQMLGYSGSRRSYQIGQIPLANRDQQKRTA
jgi:hypothetical protein